MLRDGLIDYIFVKRPNSMEQKVLIIINEIHSLKLPAVDELNPEMKLREDLGLTSFDPELTVKIEDEYDDIFEDVLSEVT